MRSTDLTSFDFIADTSAIILLARGNPVAQEAFQGKSFAIAFVTLAELCVGVMKAASPQSAWRDVLAVLSRSSTMLHVSVSTPALYARIYVDLESRGQLIPKNDIWIAALALETHLPLLARDEHFDRVRGITVIPL